MKVYNALKMHGINSYVKKYFKDITHEKRLKFSKNCNLHLK